MKKSEIKFVVELDSENIPERIKWDATDSPQGNLSEAKAISLNIWDQKQQSTMRIDLWEKDMPVDEMKRFFIEAIGGMAETVKTSTGDDFMADEMHALCRKLVKHLENLNKQ